MRPFPLSPPRALVAAAAATLLLVAPAFGQKPVAVKIPLHHMQGADVIALLKQQSGNGNGWMPEGISAINPIEKGRALSVKGTPEGVELLKGLVSLLDVPTPQVRVALRVIQVTFGPNGKKTETVLQQPTITTRQNQAAQVQVPGGQNREIVIKVTPRVLGDGRTTLVTFLSVMWPNGGRDSLERPVVVPQGQARRVIGVTNSNETPVVQAVGQGQVPTTWSAPCQAIYVEATPTKLKPAPARP
jgi:Type II secretory pathway, component PulD